MAYLHKMVVRIILAVPIPLKVGEGGLVALFPHFLSRGSGVSLPQGIWWLRNFQPRTALSLHFDYNSISKGNEPMEDTECERTVTETILRKTTYRRLSQKRANQLLFQLYWGHLNSSFPPPPSLPPPSPVGHFSVCFLKMQMPGDLPERRGMGTSRNEWCIV